MKKSAENISLQTKEVEKTEIESTRPRVHLGPNVDYCVVCGEIVPEGTTVCSGCWKEHFE